MPLRFFSLSLVFSSLVIMQFGVVFFLFMFFAVHWFFLNLWLHSFHQIWKILDNCRILNFWIYFSFLFFWYSNYMFVMWLTVNSHVPEIPLFKSLSFLFLSALGLFNFMTFLSAVSELRLIRSSDRFISGIRHFISRSVFWVFSCIFYFFLMVFFKSLGMLNIITMVLVSFSANSIIFIIYDKDLTMSAC